MREYLLEMPQGHRIWARRDLAQAWRVSNLELATTPVENSALYCTKYAQFLQVLAPHLTYV